MKVKEMIKRIPYFEPSRIKATKLVFTPSFNQGAGKIVGQLVVESGSDYRYLLLQQSKVGGATIKLKPINTTSEYVWVNQKAVQATYEIDIKDLNIGEYSFTLLNTFEEGTDGGDTSTVGTIEFAVGSDQKIEKVQLQRPGFDDTDDKEFWDTINSMQLNFEKYKEFIETILCRKDDSDFGKNFPRKSAKRRSAFIATEEYNLIKFGTEFFMLQESALDPTEISNYLQGKSHLPYFDHVFDSYQNLLNQFPEKNCSTRIRQRLENPFFIELIWSYWMEQGMLVQSSNLVNLRFQNLHVGNNALSRFDVDPLRPLSHILWGYIQDEQHRLSLPRRVQEYDHEYGLILTGKAVMPFTPADSRSKFLEAFNNLLTTTSIFFKEADDTTRIADAFPVLNSLREVHLVLAEGNHNAYGNLTWTARHEMLIQQYILARQEMREFLGGRAMVPYPERWMDRVDTVRNIMGWGSTSITYFYDLATHGEKVLLSIRYGNWSDANMPTASAANWAISFRDSIQKYIHAYRTITGVDLSADAVDSFNKEGKLLQPATLIQRRLLMEKNKQRRA